ncbi:DJ-1/PfpI family protein [Streptomyces sp. NPDC048623]|uniref:DJ-1/PfpI family protein n=1 Tax=Streptomyces sp. NPDC048623 TaxID=3155761 RepID=UPI00342D51DC
MSTRGSTAGAPGRIESRGRIESPVQIDSIAVLGYEACSEQDTITPLEIFKGTAMVTSGQIAPWQREAADRELDVRLVALEPGVIKMQMGTNVVADAVLGDDDLYDILYIPGGVGSGALLTDDRVHKLIRRHHEAGRIIAANCSGVGVVARSGIVNDETLTCVAAVARGLREDGFNVPVARRMWIGDTASRLWTFTGSYGVNGGAVAMVAHYFGREVGTIVSMMFDTIGGIGDVIFEETGPEFYQHPELEESFQDFFQPMLYPPRDDAAQA